MEKTFRIEKECPSNRKDRGYAWWRMQVRRTEPESLHKSEGKRGVGGSRQTPQADLTEHIKKENEGDRGAERKVAGAPVNRETTERKRKK